MSYFVSHLCPFCAGEAAETDEVTWQVQGSRCECTPQHKPSTTFVSLLCRRTWRSHDNHVTTTISHDYHMILLAPPLLLFQRAQQQQEEDDGGPAELLAKPREYVVKFSFPNPPPLNPPILGAYGRQRLSQPGCLRHSLFVSFHARCHVWLRWPAPLV